MLSDEEKKHIWAEERFRSEVRQQIGVVEARNTGGAKVWAFLNSPFGIWLLATAVVGSLSWGYTKWESIRAEREAFSTLIVKIDTEIESRLQYIYGQLSRDEINKRDFHFLVGSILNPDLLPHYGVFDEFRERNTRSLIFELRRLVSKGDTDPLRRSLRGIDSLLKLDSGPLPTDTPIDRDKLKAARMILLDEIAFERWYIQ